MSRDDAFGRGAVRQWYADHRAERAMNKFPGFPFLLGSAVGCRYLPDSPGSCPNVDCRQVYLTIACGLRSL
jgi:hypothetical protein